MLHKELSSPHMVADETGHRLVNATFHDEMKKQTIAHTCAQGY